MHKKPGISFRSGFNKQGVSFKSSYANYSKQVRKHFQKTSSKEFKQWFEKEYIERNHM